MNLIQAFILGILQGATEFLPISSSAHLVLVPWLLRWEPPGLLFDTMVHWGTLVAVFIYFWRDIWHLIRAALQSLAARTLDVPDARIAWGIAIGTIPAAVIGYLLEDTFEALFLSPRAVGVFLLITAALLAASESAGRQERPLGTLGLADGLLIGLAQAAAIAPGISRSGATIAAGLGRGLRRADAARFSFLLSLPAIFGAGLLQLTKTLGATSSPTTLTPVVIGFVSAAVTGYLCIRFLLRYLQRGRLYAFAAYCAVLGSAGIILSFVVR
ncbi:MAG: undecaprenyl-diphosphatase UppP [Anaerolineae bacterium]